MTNAKDRALDAATEFLTTDHQLVEAIRALRRGRVVFVTEPYGDKEIVDDHLERVAGEARHVECLCHLAGLTELARLCAKIDTEITTAVRSGRAGVNPIDRLKILTYQGRELLAAADQISIERK